MLAIRPKQFILASTLFFILLGFKSINAAEPKIEAYKAPFYVGQTVMACGKVAEVKEGKKSIFLNLDHSYPKQTLTILIWNNKLDAFTNKFGNLRTFVGERVCARGPIVDYKGRLEIVLSNPQFLRLMR